MAKLRDAVPLYPYFFSPFLPPGSLRYYILLRRRCSFMISDGRCLFFFFNSCTILDLISTHELQLLPNWIWQLPNLTFTLKVIRVPKQLIGMFTVRKPLSCFSCPFYVFFSLLYLRWCLPCKTALSIDLSIYRYPTGRVSVSKFKRDRLHYLKEEKLASSMVEDKLAFTFLC